jgi:hypothetical protein
MKTLFSPPPLGAVLYLPGLPGSGNKIYDRGPNSHTATIYGASWVGLSRGFWGLNFDGADDYLRIGISPGLKFGADDFTRLLWIKFNSVGSNQGIIEHRTDANNEERFYWSYSDSKLYWDIYSGGALIISNRQAWTPVVGQWYYLAMRRCGSIWDMLVNTGPLGTVVDTDTLPLYTGDLYLGRTSVTIMLNGQIALPRMYRRALSFPEIKRHFDEEKGLVGIW